MPGAVTKVIPAEKRRMAVISRVYPEWYQFICTGEFHETKMYKMLSTGTL